MKANISGIERHRFERDGKGVRTLVALSGCPLSCLYCINPHACEINEYSTEYTEEELLEKVLVDDVYFRATDGGITFGGGEPLLQAEFIRSFIEKSGKSWSYDVETSLAVPFEKVLLIADLVDTFYVDIKTLNRRQYKEYTLGNPKLAKSNLKKLLGIVGSEKIVVRVPIIPGFVNKRLQKQTARRLKRLGITRTDEFTYIIPPQIQRKLDLI